MQLYRVHRSRPGGSPRTQQQLVTLHRQRQHQNHLHQQRQCDVACRVAQRDLTADILQSVCDLALRARLKECRSVKTSVSCDTWSLLQGRVNGVTLRGEGWRSPLDLTAQLVECTLGEASVDVGKLFTQQAVVLTNVPVGTAHVVFSTADFGSFLVHPLMSAAVATAVQGHAFAFDSESVRISAPSAAAAGGVIEFSGTWRGDGAAGIVEDALSRFFSELELDLQGAQFRFASLRVIKGSGFAGGLADLTLTLRVSKFPPLNIQF